ncbi:MAG: DUF1800 family protein, partial [Singulisphaera sp.]
VKEAARALTGWRLSFEDLRFVASRHDAGTKTILGRAGAFDADSLARLLLEHPGTSRRLARRLCHEFLGAGAVDEIAVDALAAGLRARDLDVGWGVETVLRSRAFFAEDGLGRCIASPVEYVPARSAARVARPATEHARAGRLVRAAGPGPLLSAQRRRLARRPGLDHHPLDDRPCELSAALVEGESVASGPRRRPRPCRPARSRAESRVLLPAATRLGRPDHIGQRRGGPAEPSRLASRRASSLESHHRAVPSIHPAKGATG